MEKPAETTTPSGEKHPAFLPGFIVWPLVILLLYVLSFGPLAMLGEKGRISPNNALVRKFYTPWFWIYETTPLHKPMGEYMHFWVPTDFNKKGDMQ